MPKCDDKQIVNPVTNRCVKKDGRIGKKLIKDDLAAKVPSPKVPSPKVPSPAKPKHVPTPYELTLQLCKALQDHWDKKYPNGEYKIKEVVDTKRYYKIVALEYGHSTVHAFVGKVTGYLYMPASWNKPASGMRYDLNKGIPDVTNSGYLYKKFIKKHK